MIRRAWARAGAGLLAAAGIALTALAGSAAAAPGDLDPTFGGGGRALIDVEGVDFPHAATLDPEGRLIIAGEAMVSGDRKPAVVRLTAGGQPDPGFGGGTGYIKLAPNPGRDDFVDGVVAHADGSIVIGGTFDSITGPPYGGKVGLAKLKPDGLPDVGFGAGGIVSHDFGLVQRSGGVVALPDGRLLWFGRGQYPGNSDLQLARFTAAGAPDTSFSPTGLIEHSLRSGTLLEQYHVAVRRPDGKILIGGEGGSPTKWLLARVNPDGSLDPGFGSGGKVNAAFGAGTEYLYGLSLQADGRIVAVGAGAGGDIPIARFLPNGSFDTSFGVGGKVSVDLGGSELARSVAVQANGKIVVGGTSDASGVSEDMFVLRLNPDGSLDQGFGTAGARIVDFAALDDEATDVFVQADGKILLAGSAVVGSQIDFAAARLQGDPPPAGAGDRKVRVRLGGKRLRLNRRGVTRLRIRCPAGEESPPCRGRVVVRTGKIRLGGKKRRVTLARARFRIAAGRTKRVRIKVGRAKHRLVRRRRAARRVRVVVPVADAAGNRARIGRTMRIVPRR